MGIILEDLLEIPKVLSMMCLIITLMFIMYNIAVQPMHELYIMIISF